MNDGLKHDQTICDNMVPFSCLDISSGSGEEEIQTDRQKHTWTQTLHYNFINSNIIR